MSTAEGSLEGRVLLDRYRVDERIGRGGMGIVYRARDLRLEREVAVKVLTASALDAREHEALRAALRREATIAAGIRHPNVVTIFDHGTDPTLRLDFLVMELLEGEELGVRIRRAGLPRLLTALRVLRDVAAGLAAGHRAGLVHRDIKPGNIYLERGDAGNQLRAKVLDFGIASGIAEAGPEFLASRPNPHTPGFASPEQLLGGQPITPASDVFSLGAVGYFLLSGRRVGQPNRPAIEPFAAEEALGRLAAERRLSSEVVQILARALAHNPAARYPDAAQLRAELDGLLRITGGGSEDSARSVSPGDFTSVTSPEGRSSGQAGDSVHGVESHTVALHAGWTPTPAVAHGTGDLPTGSGWLGAFPAWAALILALGTWGLALFGTVEHPMLSWLALALSSLTTPAALRTAGGIGGSLRFAALSAAAGGAIAALLLSGTDRMPVLVGGVLAAQLVMALVGLWISMPPRNRETAPYEALQEADTGEW